MSSQLQIARAFARFVHRGQKDKGGEDYFGHLERVAEVQPYPEYAVVGYLHDSVEDTDVDLELIRDIFDSRVERSVEVLTRRKGEPYKEYILRVKYSDDKAARSVKLADLSDNLSDDRVGNIKPSLSVRYSEAKALLLGDISVEQYVRGE